MATTLSIQKMQTRWRGETWMRWRLSTLPACRPGNPVEAPLGVGEGGTDGAEGSGDDSGGSSGSESSEGSSSSDGSEGDISSSGGSGGEAMDEDEEVEWFPGGDVGAY